MKRAWFSGALAVFLAHLCLFALLVGDARLGGLMPVIVVMMLVVMNIAGLGAFLTARQAPQLRLPLALTMAPLSAVFGTAANFLLGLFGVRADLSGFYNDAGLFTMLLGYGAFVSLLGGGIGLWLGRRPEEVSAPVTALPDVAASAAEMSALPGEMKRDDLPQIRSD